MNVPVRPRIFFSLVALTLLTACGGGNPPPYSAYFNRGGPESLIDMSSEVVTLSVADTQSLKELSTWIRGDQPSRAELYCNEGDKRCDAARQTLDLHGVPTLNVPSGEYNVTLVYERLLARDCNQRFVDNRHNTYNTHHQAFGCSVAANTVQHVSNKQDFVSPNTIDTPRATGSVAQYNRAYVPRQPIEPYSVERSLAAQASGE